MAKLPGCPQSGWLPNGEARARIAAYRADALQIVVDAQAPALLATSITSWPGWQLKIDGRSVKAVPYNYAFLGVPVPAGRHTVTFRYLPVGFVIGAAITVLALGLVAVALTVAALKRRIS